MPDDQLDSVPEQEAIEGEVVTETELGAMSVDGQAADSVLDLTELINNHLAQIDNLKEQLKKLKDMLQSIYENDTTYQGHDLAVREATKIRNQTKKQLNKLPQVADLSAKVTDLRDLIKDHNKDVSALVADYAKSTGLTTLEAADGSLREIIYTAKLVRKNDFRP